MGSIWDSEYSSQNDLELRSSIGISFDFLTVIGPISSHMLFLLIKTG